MIFKGFVSWRSWILFVIITIFLSYLIAIKVEHSSSFVVIPLLLLYNIITNLTAKIIITDSSVEISQMGNRHDISLDSIRRVERYQNGWLKRNIWGMAPVGITIYYDTISDAIFTPSKADELERELNKRIEKLNKG